MNVLATDWQQITGLAGNQLKQSVFKIIQRASFAINSRPSDDPELLDLVPRLADLIADREELSSFREVLSALARSTGLWNYIDKEAASTADAIVAESVTSPELDGITLHREQIAALNDLLAGKNLILSAPTSFGKSLLIDALLASGNYKRVAIILPTIALLDEFRRRLRRRFESSFDIVMHPNDIATEGPTIFLGTQERLINRQDLGAVDLTVVDEFYKLDPIRKDERSLMLNAAVYKLLRRSRQFFFLGPNIDGVVVSGGNRWKFEFFRTRFSTVAVDTYDLRQVEDKEGRLFEEIGEDENWPALVFVSSPEKAARLASEAAQRMAVSDDSADFAEWLKENVGQRWALVPAVKYGFGVHHGRVPRAIASHMVRLFNELKLPVLFCTSTLIEGVNTSAKSVLIYDKTINRSSFDFFTFSNIRGRAGRLGRHHVGKVYLFNEPPPAQATEVSPTLFGDDEDAPDDYVVHLDETDEKRPVDARLIELKQRLDLDVEGLRLAASVGLENALLIKQHVAEALNNGEKIVWAGRPDYEEIKAVIKLICKVRKPSEFGATEKQLPYLINMLRFSPTMKGFLINHDKTFQGDEKYYDSIFKFLRACEYGLPQLFGVVEMFVKKIVARADYSAFLHELSRWFRPEELKNLDEEGIPIQISERFYHNGDSRDSLSKRLAYAARTHSSSLSIFEQRWVSAALDILSE